MTPPKRASAEPAARTNPYAARLASSSLPRLSFGAPQKIADRDLGQAMTRVAQLQNRNVRKLSGIDDIRRAGGLPQPVKDVLVLHARTLEAQELDSYIVIPEMADEWARELPDELKKKLRKEAEDDPAKKKKKGCSTKHISMGCMQNEVDQAVDDATKAARKAWNDVADEWGRFMNQIEYAQECFKDHRLGATAPLKFDVAPEFGLTFERNGSTSNRDGSASGKVTGTVTVGVPVRVDTVASMEVFYIPCLPFLVRPKSIGAEGELDVGGIIAATVDADGEFTRLLTVPPGGGVQIPVVVIPVVLGGVPIAVIDASIYLDGTLQVDGKGELHGQLRLESMQSSRFGFECSGHGCKIERQGRDLPAPANTMESVQLDGRITVKPAIYSALQLSLNMKMLNARAGPQPYLLGEIRGCLEATANQSTTGSSSSRASHALTGDLDWGIELRAEALAGGKHVARDTWELKHEHLVFRDLANSPALLPLVTVAAQAAAGQPAAFKLRMPACYPYAESLEYAVQWTGSASTASAAPVAAVNALTPRMRRSAGGSTTCVQESATRAICRGAPSSETLLYLAWPTGGNYTLTVRPTRDSHGREFDEDGTQLTIAIATSPSG